MEFNISSVGFLVLGDLLRNFIFKVARDIAKFQTKQALDSLDKGKYRTQVLKPILGRNVSMPSTNAHA